MYVEIFFTLSRHRGSTPLTSTRNSSRHWAAFIFGGTKSQDFSSRFLHLAARRQSQKLFIQNRRFSSHLHQTPEILLVKTLHCIPLVKSFASLSCEAAPCGSKDGIVFIFYTEITVAECFSVKTLIFYQKSSLFLSG